MSERKKRVTLITGGARSGKSRFALELCAGRRHLVFVATAEPCDEEMRARIEKHRRERGESFFTVEEPLDLAGALGSLSPDTEIAVVDCLTVWLGNLFHRRGATDESYPETDDFLKVLTAPPCELVLVTNEVGAGLVPAESAGRCFRDAAGRLNQGVADAADEVIAMVCGLPLWLKGGRRA